jgi:hypothetical protein
MDDALLSLQNDLTLVFDDDHLLHGSQQPQHKTYQNGTALTLF